MKTLEYVKEHLVMLAWSLFEETKLGSMFIERLERHEEDE